ncbi:MAG: glycine--tRNA ligase subunit beta [Dissulfuribacterales bacterium]
METRDLIFEIGTEELPARMVPMALKGLEANLVAGLQNVGLAFDALVCNGTPRRLAAHVAGLQAVQSDREEVVAGPPARISYDADGRPTKAAFGFAKAQNVPVEALYTEDTDKGLYVFVRKHVRGRPSMEILKELLPRVITSISLPKTMRWNSPDLRFARPIRWLVAVFGHETIDFSLSGMKSGNTSRGHRFMANETFEVASSLQEYRHRLQERYVIVDQDVRKRLIWEEALKAAQTVNGRPIDDEELLELNTHLVEYPSVVCGSFSRDFLRLPKEVLITSMREHQKYFAVADATGGLLPYFIAVNNTRSPRPELVQNGHERVLRARLTDAAFFFDEDVKRSLQDYVEGLKGVVFHQKLGTLFDKTMRVEAIATFLAQRLAPDAVHICKRAALLCKADLETQMVSEFPSLQGIMGREYALRSGEPQEVALAISEHYMPVKSGGELPATLTGAIVSIADKIDTIVSMFAVGLQPTGAADPYALRRLALGILNILIDRNVFLSLKELIAVAVALLRRNEALQISGVLNDDVAMFFQRRFVADCQAKGYAPEIIEAAVRAGFDDPVDAMMRIKALTAVRVSPDFAPLGLLFKRVMNILKGAESVGVLNEKFLTEAAEIDLYKTYSALKSDVVPLMQNREYEQALRRLLMIKPQIDVFFDHVMVMVENVDIKNNRLCLLHGIAELFLHIADMSVIS